MNPKSKEEWIYAAAAFHVGGEGRRPHEVTVAYDCHGAEDIRARAKDLGYRCTLMFPEGTHPVTVTANMIEIASLVALESTVLMAADPRVTLQRTFATAEEVKQIHNPHLYRIVNEIMRQVRAQYSSARLANEARTTGGDVVGQAWVGQKQQMAAEIGV